VGTELFHADRQTDMRKLIAFRNTANATKNIVPASEETSCLSATNTSFIPVVGITRNTSIHSVSKIQGLYCWIWRYVWQQLNFKRFIYYGKCETTACNYTATVFDALCCLKNKYVITHRYITLKELRCSPVFRWMSLHWLKVAKPLSRS
jgi:hypothetical protein